MMYAVLSAWASLQRSQWFKKSRLAKLRDIRLRRIVDHAYGRVPFYSRLYRSQGVDPETIKGVSDLSKLPVMTREHLQEESLDARTATGTDLNACMLRSTSGTTGSPVRVYEDQNAVAYRDALNLRLLWAYGARPYHRLCRTTLGDSTRLKPKQTLSDAGLWGFLRRHCMKQILYTTDPDKAVVMLSDWRPDILLSDPPYLRLLIKSAKTIGLPMNCKTVVASGQVLDKSTRSYIRNGFNADVYDHYGLEESGGSIAWECPMHSGYHVNDESVILEFLRDGQPVGSGEPGEVHVTSLTRTVTPIIRYATGDIAMPLEDECQCGRGLSLLEGIQGRIWDYVVTRDGKCVSSSLVISRIEEVQGIEHYKVFQNIDQTIDLHIKFTSGMEEPASAELREACSDLFGNTPSRILKTDHLDHVLWHKYRIVESALMNKLLKEEQE